MNDQTQQSRKWWAPALMIGSIVGLVCLPLGALGSKLGMWSFLGGFMLLAVGTVLAAAVFFLGVIALAYCFAKKRSAERGSVFIGVAISAVILGLMGSQYMAASSVPPIHNISTDTQQPPQFDKIVAIRAAQEGVNSLAYDANVLAEQQRAAYPSIQPLISSVSSDELLSQAVEVIESMGLEVVNADASAGIVEATDTTFWFGFKDDVVVRVKPQGRGSIVDVRSVSRVGESDLGKNAARISEILAGIKSY